MWVKTRDIFVSCLRLTKRKKMTKKIELDSDNMVVYIDGEYYPARLEYHQNDVVDQHVVAVIHYEIELGMYDEPQLELVVDNDNDKD